MHTVSTRVLGLYLVLATSLAQASGILGPRVGDSAPEFELRGLDGKTYSLTALRQDGPVLLVFWSTGCPYCAVMLPELEALGAALDKHSVTAVALNVGYETQAEVERFIELQHLTFLVLNEDDKKASVAKAYHLSGTPTVVLVTTRGEIAYFGHRLPDLDATLAPPAGDVEQPVRRDAER